MKNNWPAKKLGDVTDTYGGGTPRRSVPEYWDNDVPWLTMEDAKNLNVMGTAQYISNQGLQNSNAQLVPAGSVNLSCTASVGNVTINRIPLATNQQFNSFHPHKELLPEFLAYELMCRKNEIENLGGKTTIPFISKASITNFQVYVPTINTQRKIATILSSVDEAIQKTDQIVQKTEVLKQGMMQELLTKGIGHKKFKKTKIGDIPEEWTVNSILESDIKIIDGDRGVNYPKQHEFYSKGFCLFLSNRNIRNDSFDFSEPIFISQEKDQQLRKGKLNRWDIVLTTRGTVGNVAIYDDSITYDHIRINSGMLIFRVGKTIASEFLYFLLKSPLFKERYIQLGSGSAQPQLPISSLRNLLIPIPSQEEQLKIVNQLKMLDRKHSSEIKQMANLIELKRGLMQDIFSQKVQIN